MEVRNVISRDNLGEGFRLDNTRRKIDVVFPENTGVKTAELSGTTLNLGLQNGDTKSVPLASLVPQLKVEKFLSAVRYNETTKSLEFDVTGDDGSKNTITTLVSDLILTAVGNGLTGNGTTTSPINLVIDSANANGLQVTTAGVGINLDNLKPKASVHFADAFGVSLGYGFTAQEATVA